MSVEGVALLGRPPFFQEREMKSNPGWKEKYLNVGTACIFVGCELYGASVGIRRGLKAGKVGWRASMIKKAHDKLESGKVDRLRNLGGL